MLNELVLDRGPSSFLSMIECYEISHVGEMRLLTKVKNSNASHPHSRGACESCETVSRGNGVGGTLALSHRRASWSREGILTSWGTRTFPRVCELSFGGNINASA